MKITIDIDCTPEEARRFLGLPDLERFQDMVMEELRARFAQGLSAADMQSLMKMWMPMGGKGFEDMQKAFWSLATGGAGAGASRSDRSGTGGKDEVK